MQNFQSDIFKNNLEIREAFIEVRSIEEKNTEHLSYFYTLLWY
jgi:hypothetical protein